MPHLNKLFSIFIIFLLPNLVHGAELLIFDSPNMVILTSAERSIGYYGAVEGDKNCEFFFFETEKPSAMDGDDLKISLSSFSFTFPPKSYEYKDRDKRFDSKGELYGLQNQRVVRIENPEPGCIGWAVGAFKKKPSDKDAVRYTIASRSEALSIRVVAKKAFLYKKAGARFDRTRAYLVTGDVIVVLATSSTYSHVRYTNPDSAKGQVTFGWLRSSEIVNPFPPANKS